MAAPPAGDADAGPILDRELRDTESSARLRDRLVDGPVAAAVTDPGVLDAMRHVPRHSFVPTRYLADAYLDEPVGIGRGQTVSQPSLVAMMVELLDLRPGDRVLEVGTGSGYEAAVLAGLTDEVYTVERDPDLAEGARAVLDALGVSGVHVDVRDGHLGWPEHAPYRAIVVAAAAERTPPALVDQLEPDGGRLVIPIGPAGGGQMLWLLTRHGERVDERRIIAVRFVPLT